MLQTGMSVTVRQRLLQTSCVRTGFAIYDDDIYLQVLSNIGMAMCYGKVCTIWVGACFERKHSMH